MTLILINLIVIKVAKFKAVIQSLLEATDKYS